jgi:hypothetical protein
MISRICFAILCVTCSLNAKIIETRHIAEVIPLIDAETWFLVDLDHTLYEAKQALGHAHWFYEEIQNLIDQGLSKEDAIRTMYPQWVKTQRMCDVQAIEEQFITEIAGLQKKGIVVMGLTHRQPIIAGDTLRQVGSLGVDFQRTAPSKETFAVPASSPTLYTHGILFVSDYNKKGEVLLPFLKMIGKMPKKVVFIDDKRKNVEELEKTLSAQDIEYIGVYYTAIDHAAPVYSRELAEFQSKFLDKIMSNEAAELLIQHALE